MLEKNKVSLLNEKVKYFYKDKHTQVSVQCHKFLR